MVRSIREHGWVDSAFETFDISAIVIVSCIVGVTLVARGDERDVAKWADIRIGLLFVALVILPITSLSWLAVGILCLYILLFTDETGSVRRGAVILLAVTIPMLAIPWLFELFPKTILGSDALLVSLVLGTDRIGNFVEFADHSADLVVFPGCSSLPNIALAILCWILLSQTTQHQRRWQDLIWCLLAITSVMVINVGRISLMGLNDSYFMAIHSAVGDMITNLLILTATIGICVLGMRREIFANN
jgi:exosortase/archaeosortase family protein